MPKQPHDHTSATAGANLLTILDQEIEARDCDPTGASRAGEMQEAREAVADLLAALDGRVPGDPHSLARVQWLDALLGVSDPADYAKSWREDQAAMAETIHHCRELVRLVRTARTRAGAIPLADDIHHPSQQHADNRT